RLADGPSLGAAALLGAAIALAALTRGEAIALGVLLAAPLLWRGGEGSMGRRAALGVACLASAALVLAPWAIRNATTFERPVLLSTNGDSVFAGANCESTYFGELIGAWDFECFGGPVTGDEAQAALQYRERGFTYASEHTGRIPVVVAARLGRMLDVYRPWGQGGFFASQEGRQVRFHRAGLVMYWALIPLAVGGVVLLRRRRRRVELLVLLAPFVLIVLVGAAVYGNTRFRTSAEPFLVILAAIAIEAAAVALAARRSRTVAR
nr:glycosyl transferase [Solirubrobacterales bacterium]